jgi:tetratricopeptide (TPR) repeat protein
MDGKRLHSLLETGADHQRNGRLAEAIRAYDEILCAEPLNCDALHLKGLVLFQSGRPQESVALIGKAIEINPGVPLLHFHLAKAKRASGDIDGACRSYQQAITLKPDYSEAYYDLGQTFGRLGAVAEAEKCFKAAAHFNRGLVDAWINLGNIEKGRGKTAEARAYYRGALSVKPDSFEAANNLGNLAIREGRLEEAARWYRRSAEAGPEAVDPAANLGSVLMRLGRFDEALAQFDRVLSFHPAHAGTHFNKAWLLLLAGRFEEGWDEYEWRLRVEGALPVVRSWLESAGKPAWDGGKVAGQTILVHCEQGLGDTIQFVRYLPMLKRMGARVLLVCQRELVSLLSNGCGADRILPESESGRIDEPFDVFAALLGLPRLFRTVAADIPSAIPYLCPGSEKCAKWKSRISGPGFKVGLVWAGRPTNAEDWRRSCSLSDFAPLASIPGLEFFSFQKGPAAAQVSVQARGMPLTDLSGGLEDFEDTAAALLQMDLVLAVDTAVAHLAGALGKRVWTILPHFPEWRWLTDREDTPWYPTMRLYRQTSPGNWRRVMEKIARDLSGISAGGCKG